MAKNPNISELDAAQAFKRALDGNHDAIRIVQALNTEMIIELNEADGDSVQAVARCRLVQPSDGEVRSDDLREICKYGEGKVEVSPDGQEWVELSISNLEVKAICALKLRVEGCKVVGRS